MISDGELKMKDGGTMKTDTQATLEDLKLLVQEFCHERDWDQFHGVKDLAIGAVTEAAELAEVFRFQSPERCEEIMKNGAEVSVRDELADVLFFVVRIAQKYNIDLNECFTQKLEKNRIKYPADKARGSNKKYDQY